jgi:hypothetical protein
VAHVCNPSYSGGREQKDGGWKPAQANSSQDPILKKNHHKNRLVEWLKVKALVQAPAQQQQQQKKGAERESKRKELVEWLKW